MIKYFWIKSAVLLLLCLLPLKNIAQTASADLPDSTVTEQIDSASVAAGGEEEEDYQEYAPYHQMRHVPDSLVNALKANKKLQYQTIKDTSSEKFRWLDRFFDLLAKSFGTLRYVLMALVLAGLGFLVYRYMKANGMTLFRKPALIDGLTEIQTEELHSGEEYEEKIKSAIATGDTRQAIRWWYLYTLFQLAAKQMIVAGREKTNNDYLRSMRSSPYYKKFAALTLDYEYSWYGGFEVSEDSFRNINQEFRDFNNAIGKAS